MRGMGHQRRRSQFSPLCFSSFFQLHLPFSLTGGYKCRFSFSAPRPFTRESDCTCLPSLTVHHPFPLHVLASTSITPMARAIGGGCASASTWKGKTGGESEGRQVQSDSRARANGHGAEKENRHLYPPVSEKQEMQLKEARKTKWREP